MTDNSLLFQDNTSEKYFKFSTRTITRVFIQNVLTQLKKKQPKNILDVGCGTGHITNIISQSMNVDIICCDMNSNRISFVKEHFHLETLIADISYLPFKDSSFDTVLALEIIEHLPCPDSAVIELKRVTKKDLIITVPNDPYFMIANFLRGKNLKFFGNPPDHVNHFNKRSLNDFLSKFELTGKISKNAILWLIANVHK